MSLSNGEKMIVAVKLGERDIEKKFDIYEKCRDEITKFFDEFESEDKKDIKIALGSFRVLCDIIEENMNN